MLWIVDPCYRLYCGFAVVVSWKSWRPRTLVLGKSPTFVASGCNISPPRVALLFGFGGPDTPQRGFLRAAALGMAHESREKGEQSSRSRSPCPSCPATFYHIHHTQCVPFYRPTLSPPIPPEQTWNSSAFDRRRRGEEEINSLDHGQLFLDAVSAAGAASAEGRDQVGKEDMLLLSRDQTGPRRMHPIKRGGG